MSMSFDDLKGHPQITHWSKFAFNGDLMWYLCTHHEFMDIVKIHSQEIYRRVDIYAS